jgi:hypothetical protein
VSGLWHGTVRRIVTVAIAAAASFAIAGSASAQTTVTQDGPCAFTIVVPIEVYGPLATPEVIARWKKNIEDRWNGPTEEVIKEIAARTELWAPPEHLDWQRDKLNQRYQEFLKSIGADGRCTEVNCCTICLRVDIRVRQPGKPDPKYHQIEPVPDGLVRSYVRWGGPRSVHERSVSGQWEVETSEYAPEAHEVGHLMGLDDKYSDKKDASGNVESHGHPGHEIDLMNESSGWPQEAAFAEILKLAGLELPNCCREPDTVAQVTNMAIRYGGDMIAGCNRDGIQQAILELQAQRASIIKDNFALPVKFQLVDSIDSRLRALEKALKDCPPPPSEGITVTSSGDGGQWCTYGDGIGQPVLLIPTDPNGVPIAPGGPVISGPPSGPSTTPGTVPPTTPGQAPPTQPGSKPPVTPASGSPPSLSPPSYPPPRHGYPTHKPPATPTAGPPPMTPPPSTPPTTTKPPEQGTPPPVTSTPPETPPITIFVKATQSVLEGQPQGAAVPGFNTALFPPTKPDLPFTTGQTQTAQQDTGFDKDPVKCTTGQGGECKLELDLGTQLEWGVGLRGSTGLGLGRGWNNYRLDYSVPQTSGGVVETTGMKVIPDPKQGLPNNVTVSSDTFSIGNRSFLRLGLDQPLGLNYDFGSRFSKLFGGDYLADYCRDKQPGPPLGAQPASFSSISRALPEASVRLRLSILDQLRARP